MIDTTPITDLLHPRAIILHGSLAAGGFRPGQSDIDLLVVVDTPLTDAQIAALTAYARTTALGDAAGLDLHVVTTAVARDPTPAPPLELFIGRSTELEIETRVPSAPDLPAELSMARAQGRSLFGPAPHELLAPVPDAWIIARGRHWLRTWLTLTDDLDHLEFMHQTACRIWHLAATGHYCSKQDAVAWAHAQDPSLTDLTQLLNTVLSETASRTPRRLEQPHQP
ncbi:nucleotidyltransferase domain-containing protein [Paractinoplanes lichenicola]|uniref:Nucleotidyltransferase domain-containing protein n=1 Tax=Paractinoplanes lichenicola TaxID=2802976 RepID=A0ABS1VY77_9ACTN|nr:nucleotidyltransferase domain-containing protein [Actinoplanes lichenicola]MBL7259378.1 nucleotidyltransferase domain-containing protein [Actinoplanes lichenicola]